MKDYAKALNELDRQISYMEGVNFDSGEMYRAELDALKAQRKALDAERIASLSPNPFND